MGKNSAIVIRRMAKYDVPALVRLHSEVFPGYNATIMGTGYLKRLYNTLACDSACISIVALEGGKILGWIGGVGDWPAFEKALIRRNILRSPAIFFSILKNRPRLLAKAFTFVWRAVLGFVRIHKQRKERVEGVPASREAALLVIGVSPGRQKQSLGQVMMEDFHGRLLSKGFLTSTLNTFSDNESGNKAFQKAGYILYGMDSGVNHYAKYLIREEGD